MKHLMLLSFVLSLALLFTGCGNDDPTTPVPPVETRNVTLVVDGHSYDLSTVSFAVVVYSEFLQVVAAADDEHGLTFMVPAAVGTYNQSGTPDQSTMAVVLAGVNYLDSNCSVTVTVLDDTHVSGYFTANLLSEDGRHSIVVSGSFDVPNVTEM